jgi:hypothetical protein
VVACFLGEDVWRRSDMVIVVVMRSGDAVVVEVIQLRWRWRWCSVMVVMCGGSDDV